MRAARMVFLAETGPRDLRDAIRDGGEDPSSAAPDHRRASAWRPGSPPPGHPPPHVPASTRGWTGPGDASSASPFSAPLPARRPLLPHRGPRLLRVLGG